MAKPEAIFNYSLFGISRCDYAEHSGQPVVVLGVVEEFRADSTLYRIKAADGWKGNAWGFELIGVRNAGVGSNNG